MIYTLDMEEQQRIVDCLVPAFEHLESRVLGTCDGQYSSMHTYHVSLLSLTAYLLSYTHCNSALLHRYARFSASSTRTSPRKNLTLALVAELSIVMPITQYINIADLQRELPCYTSTARIVSFFSDDVDPYMDAVVSFWAQAPNGANGMPTWVRQANIAFAMTPNSASCERVFCLL